MVLSTISKSSGKMLYMAAVLRATSVVLPPAIKSNMAEIAKTTTQTKMYRRIFLFIVFIVGVLNFKVQMYKILDSEKRVKKEDEKKMYLCG